MRIAVVYPLPVNDFPQYLHVWLEVSLPPPDELLDPFEELSSLPNAIKMKNTKNIMERKLLLIVCMMINLNVTTNIQIFYLNLYEFPSLW